MTAIGYVAIAAALVLAAAVVWWDKRRLACTLRTIDSMLDEALRGDFSETRFDETRLSATETKLAQYLSASALSARALKRQRDQIQSLVADISHQTKTPIANVQIYVQMLAEQPLSPDSRACVSALAGQADKLQELVEALVKTARLESGVITMHPAPASLLPMLQAATAQFAPKAAAKDLSLTLYADELDAVFDPKWTAEAVCNLLDNAVKYTPAGGSVTVRASAYPLFARVDVTDTGAGVAEEERPLVFQRFYRGARHRSEEGVGVGLYLARQIAEGQGGYIKVSAAQGGGACFSLYLPRG